MRRLLLVLALASACGKGDKPPPPSSGKPGAGTESGPTKTAEPSEAQKLYATVCATCHGANGAGDGPAAEHLTIKPRNYTDPEWQKSTSDEDIKQIIVEGGQALGKSSMMPANEQLKDKPDVLNELVRMIRGFGRK